MRTNEEIVRKIREMIEGESEKLWDLCSVLNVQDEEDAAKASETKSKIRRHTAALAALVDLEEFADADQEGERHEGKRIR